jgi:hypothetical protein
MKVATGWGMYSDLLPLEVGIYLRQVQLELTGSFKELFDQSGTPIDMSSPKYSRA